MLVILMICCILIYGMVMIFLPKNYRSDLESQFVSEFQTLVQNIEKMELKQIPKILFLFLLEIMRLS